MSDPIIRGLTIWQPWAWLIAAGLKPLENRDWRPPASLVGQHIAIHAGQHWDLMETAGIMRNLVKRYRVDQERLGHTGPLSLQNLMDQRGHILAVARVRGWVSRSKSPWFVGDYGWVLSDVVKLPEAVPHKGSQGLWALDAEALAKVRAQWSPQVPSPVLNTGDLCIGCGRPIVESEQDELGRCGMCAPAFDPLEPRL